jgi:hypothetical protein
MFDIFPEFLNSPLYFLVSNTKTLIREAFFSDVQFSIEINKLHLIVTINLIADQVQGQFNAV